MMLFGTADLVLQAAIPAQARNPSWTEMLGPAQDTIPQAEGFKVVWRHDLQAAIAEAKAPTPLPTKQAFVGILTAVNDQSPNLAAAPSSSGSAGNSIPADQVTLALRDEGTKRNITHPLPPR